MHIKEIIGIKNYRNLTDITFGFNEAINFIVGENNIGKTNLVELLNKIINTGKFNEEDFYNVREPIEVIFTVEYSEEELGFFESVFDIDNELTITITAFQDGVDSRIEYWHTESELNISPRTVKRLNFLYYSSLRAPNKELNFINNIGTGKVLNYIMKKSLEKKEIGDYDLINEEQIEEVLEELNEQFSKLNVLSSEKIEAYLNYDKENIINRLLEIGDANGRRLSNLGDGLQYAFNIFLNILELLVHLKITTKDEDFANYLVVNEEGKKLLPLIIGLDEPEIHQHPYRQRALIKGIMDVMNNNDENFVQIVSELFGIDGFVGQVFVVTHSPSILLDDYTQIIRIFEDDTDVNSVSGCLLGFDKEIHKHLLRSFIYFKEAMFSKAIILVEGDTEFGAVPVFVKRLGLDLDKNGVGIVKLDGADSVLKYLELFTAYSIDAVAILDKDKEEKYAGNPNIIFTTGIDFEEEVFDNFSFHQYLKYLKNIDRHNFLCTHLKRKIEDFNPREFCRKPLTYEIQETVGLEIMTDLRETEIEELRGLKNAVNGALLAKLVDNIPESFEQIIKRVVLGE